MGQSLLPPSGGDDHIVPVDLKAALEERYLAYALSTIMHRALPDVREQLAAEGALPVRTTPQAFADLIASEIPRWREVVQRAQMKVE